MPQRASLFGVPLEELMGYDGEKGAVPRVVKDCVQYLRETGETGSSILLLPYLIVTRNARARPLPSIAKFRGAQFGEGSLRQRHVVLAVTVGFG